MTPKTPRFWPEMKTRRGCFCVVAEVSLVDIGAFDLVTGELLSVFDGCSMLRERLPSVALRRSSKPFCARCVCLSLEQVEEPAGVGCGIEVTRYASHGTFTE